MNKTVQKAFNNLPESGKIAHFKEEVLELNRLRKKLDKAVIREATTEGTSRAQNTTLVAKSRQVTKAYNEQLELIKELARLL